MGPLPIADDAPFDTTRIPRGWNRRMTQEEADAANEAFPVPPHAVKNEYETNQQGRPIFYDAEFIQIVVPGARDVSTFPLDDHYKKRFARAYAQWKAEGEQLKIQGTILAELPWLTKSQIAELNYSNIRTVEELAAMSDVNAMKFMKTDVKVTQPEGFKSAVTGGSILAPYVRQPKLSLFSPAIQDYTGNRMRRILPPACTC